MVRYEKLGGKFPREILLLKSQPCYWGRCIFCDYILDNGGDFSLNDSVLGQIEGDNGGKDGGNNGKKALPLQIICSASYFEIPENYRQKIEKIVLEKNIKTLILELHWAFREDLAEYRRKMQGFGVEVIGLLGVETFDINYRKYLDKDMPDISAEEISKYFQWANIMYGMPGQNLEMLRRDIEIGLKNFQRMNLNVFTNNTTPVKRDEKLVEEFYNSDLFEKIKNLPNLEVIDYGDDRAPDVLQLGRE